LLDHVQQGLPLSIGERVKLALQLAVPAILSQLTTIVMEYADAAMVGHLGAAASAAIGLVSTSTWLLGGLCSSVAAGFAVLVAQRIGARDRVAARGILRQAITFSLVLSCCIGLLSVGISPFLPHWLGGGEDVCRDASLYFLVFGATIPIWEMNFLMAGMLRASGNVKLPSVVNICVCVLNVALNYVFIFLLELGVLGAALATSASMCVSLIILASHVWRRSPELALTQEKGSFRLRKGTVKKALHIGVPMAIEHIAMCSAHIMFTIIVAPLGTVAIAANAFGITIEGLCYMPGYGIGDAATTLIGQTIGAKRPQLQRSFGNITMLLGIGFMTLTGILMYVFVPYLMPLMTPDAEVQALTVMALRIEAFAEPLYAASIVAYGIFVGAGDTKVPCVMNLGSIWLVRIPMAIWLVGVMGFKGVWIAMAAELCFRGSIFLVRLASKQKKLRNQSEISQ